MSAVPDAHDVVRSSLFPTLIDSLFPLACSLTSFFGQYHSCLVVALVIARRCRHATFTKTVARIDRRATADAIPRPVTIACVNSLVHENVSRLVSNAISP